MGILSQIFKMAFDEKADVTPIGQTDKAIRERTKLLAEVREVRAEILAGTFITEEQKNDNARETAGYDVILEKAAMAGNVEDVRIVYGKLEELDKKGVELQKYHEASRMAAFTVWKKQQKLENEITELEARKQMIQFDKYITKILKPILKLNELETKTGGLTSYTPGSLEADAKLELYTIMAHAHMGSDSYDEPQAIKEKYGSLSIEEMLAERKAKRKNN